MRCLLTILFYFIILSSPAQDINRVRKYLDTLCAPGMHGRGAEFNGDRIAAEYLKELYKEIGLQPFRENFFQHFNYNINTFPARLQMKADGRKLKPGEDYIVNAISSGGKGRYKVRAFDTLIFHNDQLREAFLNSSNKKKVFIYESAHYSRIIELPGNVLDKIHEAPCVIELQDRKLTAGLSGAQLSNPFFQVRKESMQQIPKRVKYILDAELVKNYQSQNVIGYIKGSRVPDSLIIISAHYDHLGRMGKETYFPGANDNGSGVSMLLELARYYSKPENAPEFTLVFMAFGAEEAGLIGSKYFTEHPLFPLKRIRFMINLDLLGTGDDGMTVVNGTLFPVHFSMLTDLNNENNYLPEIKKRGAAANSDHFYFTEKGVPAFFFYTLGGISAYHDIYDVPETLPLTKFTEVFSLITAFIKKL